MSLLRRVLLITAVVLLTQGFGAPGPTGQEQPVDSAADEVAPDDPGAARELLDAIREDLVQLRFEKALAALEPLLTRPGLTDDERIEAMVLRSQTHAAFGDFDAAAEDFRQILLRRPAWSPDTSLTPKKAMSRFDAVRDKLIGRVRFVLDPADSTLVIDGSEIPDALEPIAMLAGTHEVQLARRGHDPLAQTVEVEAGESVELELALIPNARTVILRTEPDDVEVWLDGVFIGRTARAETFVGVGSDTAELVIEDVPIGEHRFEFRKECRRTERLVDALNVDLLDRAPKRYDTVRLAESNVLITPSGGPAGTRLRVDGAEVATLPVDVVQACPGERLLEALFEGRVLWAEKMTLTEAVPVTLAIRARPNLVLVGMDALPRDLAELAADVNRTVMDAPADADYGDLSAWSRRRFARGADLALAPAGGGRQGMDTAWWLYSPVLGTLERVVDLPDAAEPSWTVRAWGLTAADDDGPLVVERLGGGEPAVGRRIVSAGGEPVPDAATLDRILKASSADSIPMTWRAADGTTVEGGLASTLGPWLREQPPAGVQDAFRAAWAVVASESDSNNANAALANLALLLGTYGEHDLALRTWRRVDWPDRRGIGVGTVAYYAGKTLQALGRDREAVEALRRAASSEATAVSDDGPPVAPAARDRLADLGESP